MKAIDRALLERLMQMAGDRLKGRWVLLGGTLLPLLGIEYRVTTDIDLVGLGTSEQGQTLALMTIAEELGLPVEAINQAAGYFLSRQEPFEDHLLLLKKGRTAEIFRPDLYLFLMLKAGRLSESDLSDCLELLRIEGPLSGKDARKLEKRIREELKKSDSKAKDARFRKLLEALKA